MLKPAPAADFESESFDFLCCFAGYYDLVEVFEQDEYERLPLNIKQLHEHANRLIELYNANDKNLPTVQGRKTGKRILQPTGQRKAGQYVQKLFD